MDLVQVLSPFLPRLKREAPIPEFQARSVTNRNSAWLIPKKESHR